MLMFRAPVVHLFASETMCQTNMLSDPGLRIRSWLYWEKKICMFLSSQPLDNKHSHDLQHNSAKHLIIE